MGSMTGRALILGGTGMLGLSTIEVFADRGIQSTATTRDLAVAPEHLRSRFVSFDVLHDSLDSLVAQLGPHDTVVNCIGIIKSHIVDSSRDDRALAIAVNSAFPHALAALSEAQGFRVIQIATDCVYDGALGGYDEVAPHNAHDVYGHTKSLGEAPGGRFLNLRASIIGPELRTKSSLLEWVLLHEAGSAFGGYVDHLWNGVTARAFAKVAAGIIQSGNDLAGTQHLVPSDVVTKHELSLMILETFERRDVEVTPTTTAHPIDRTLTTLRPDVNDRLWKDAGYDEPPSVLEMVRELAPARTSPTGDIA
jgi:dTDP-4-dehydrorhamnose reductase